MEELTFKMVELFHFSSGTRGHFSNVTFSKHTFDIFGHLVKEMSYRFLKDGLAPKLLRETWKGVLFRADCFSVIFPE